MNQRSHLILFALIPLLVLSCAQEGPIEDYVARVGDSYLSQEELAASIPPLLAGDDSVKRANVFVNNWVRNQVVLNKAKFNLNENDSRFEAKMKDYLNDLMIYEYEQELVRQQLDTAVNQEEMLAFYEQNKHDFLLKDYVLKIRYLVVPQNVEGLQDIVDIFRQDKDSMNLAEFAKEHAYRFIAGDGDWVYLEELIDEIPITKDYLRGRLGQQKFFQKESDGKLYLIYVEDYEIKDGESPFELEQKKIKSSIINSRKLNLLEEMRDNSFKEALKKGTIEIR